MSPHTGKHLNEDMYDSSTVGIKILSRLTFYGVAQSLDFSFEDILSECMLVKHISIQQIVTYGLIIIAP